MSLFSDIAADLKRYNRKNTSLYNLVWCLFLEPGFQAALSYRVRNRTARLPLIGSLAQAILAQLSAMLSGCYISARCTIGPGLFLAHPIGVVIAKNAVIGSNVDIYQNVTLGQLSDANAGAPTIGDNCCLYAGAVILGDITVGQGARIGANAVVIKDIPASSTAVGVPARVLPVKNVVKLAA